MKLITDIDELRKQNVEVTIKEGKEITKTLFKFLEKYNKTHKIGGIGIAAPQLGIHVQVCLVRNNYDLISIMNPKIIEKAHVQLPHEEGCLSLPGIKRKIPRYPWLILETLNFGREMFGDKELRNPKRIFTCYCIQHEIDHLFGKLIIDYKDEYRVLS